MNVSRSAFPGGVVGNSRMASPWDSGKGAPSQQEGKGPHYPGLVTAFPWIILAVVVTDFLLLFAYSQWRMGPMHQPVWIVLDDFYIWSGEVLSIPLCLYALSQLRGLGLSFSDPLARRAWFAIIALGLSGLADASGQSFWIFWDSHGITPPYPSIADAFFLMSQPFFLIGIALLIPRGGTGMGRTRLIVDAGTMVLAVLAISWYFVLNPTLAGLTEGTPVLSKVMAMTLPSFDLCVGVAAVLLLVNPFGALSLSTTLLRFTLGVAALAVTDAIYGSFQAEGVYFSGMLVDIGWPIAWFMICWAMITYPFELASLVRLQRQEVERIRPRRAGGTASALTRALTPLFFVIMACALLVIGVALRNANLLLQVSLVCLGLLILPTIRQMLTLVDNMLLNDRLRVALDQSQREFRQSQDELLDASSQIEHLEALQTSIAQIQQVHARLSQGDFSVRVPVEGPLAPVAMSLNLLIERMTRWRQALQANEVMEREARQLRQMLETLAEGQIVESSHLNQSPLSTGGALVSAHHLQNQLERGFRHLRESVNTLGRRMQLLETQAKHLHQSLLEQGGSLQQREEMAVLEKGLANQLTALQDVWKQSSLYAREGISSSTISSQQGMTHREIHG